MKHLLIFLGTIIFSYVFVGFLTQDYGMTIRHNREMFLMLSTLLQPLQIIPIFSK